MSDSIHLLKDAITAGWLLALVAMAGAAIFARRFLRTWMIALLLAFPIAILWWHLWMYHAWIGTPHLIHHPLHVDGEGSYDATFVEMVFILCLTLPILDGLTQRLLPIMCRQHKHPSYRHVQPLPSNEDDRATDTTLLSEAAQS